MLEKIISAGQTGVDRAALDVAPELGISSGGWCPKGHRAEDDRIPDHYPLKETSSSQYPVRTRKNVEDSDETLILTRGPVTGGTALTVKPAKQLGKSCKIVDLSKGEDPQAVLVWATENGVKVMNVAEPRESTTTGAHARAVAS